MRSKTKKILLTTLCGTLCMAAGTAFGAVTYTVNADEETPTTIENVTPTMIQGAAVRLADDGVLGLRYGMTVAKTEYEGLMANETYDNLQFGIFIAPNAYNTVHAIANEANVIGENAKYVWDEDVEGKATILNLHNGYMWETGDTYNFYANVVNMNDENLEKDYIGVGYIAYEVEGETHYKFAANNDNVRSMETVATAAYLDTTETAPTAEQKTALKESYLLKCEPETVTDLTAVTSAYYLKGAEGDFEIALDGLTAGEETFFVKVNGTEVAHTVGDNKVVFAHDYVSTLASGDYDVTVRTLDKQWDLSFAVADAVITTKAEFDARFDHNGQYVVLGNNIDLAGEDVATYSETWTGTFNGMGYTIANYNIKGENGNRPTLFPTIGASGTVKNFAVVGVTVWHNYNGAKLGGAGITNKLEGTLENIFAKGIVKSPFCANNPAYASSIVAMSLNVKATIKNVFALLEAEGGTYNANYGGVICPAISYDIFVLMNMSNVYAINLTGTDAFNWGKTISAFGFNSGCLVNKLPYGDSTISRTNTIDTDLLASNGVTYKNYQNVLSFHNLAQFKNKTFGNGTGDRSPYMDLTAFTGGYWDTTGDYPVFATAKAFL